MKFDVVVGNPPYLKSLHLKILEVAVKTLKPKGLCVWLSPARWCQDPFGPYKRSDYNKYKHLPFTSFEVVRDAIQLFNIPFTFNLMISTLDNSKESILKDGYFFTTNKLEPSPYSKSIFDKVFNPLDFKNNVVFDDPLKYKFCVKIECMADSPYDKNVPLIVNIKKYNGVWIAGKLNGKTLGELKTRQKTVHHYDNMFLLPFNNEEEGHNFVNSTLTSFVKFWMLLITTDVHLNHKNISFNIDYKEPWTDERFYKHFKLTQEEINYIEETIKSQNLPAGD